MRGITRRLWAARVTAWLGVVIASAAVMAGSALATSAAPGRTVRDADNQFAVDVPPAWTVRTPNGSVTLAATAPAMGERLPDSLNVVVRGVPTGMSPQSCETEAEWVTQYFAHVSFTTVSKGPGTVAGLPAFLHVYTWTANSGEERWSQQACLVQQGKAFVLTGTTTNDPATLPRHARLLKRIINSLRITEQPRNGASAPQLAPSP